MTAISTNGSIAEDEGLEIMLNEHHQTATCVDPAAPIVLGALARLSKKARLLILGNPVANRRQPVRVAEEMALVDMLSKGRLECGFVRGVPYEISPANSNPVRMNERQWEAMDLIVKAWTTMTGRSATRGGSSITARSTSGRGRSSSRIRRSGISTTTPGGAQRVGTRGYVQATFLTGFERHPGDLDRYRKGWREAGRGNDVPINRLAYAAHGLRRRKRERRPMPAPKSCCGTSRANKVPPHFSIRRATCRSPAHERCCAARRIDQHAGIQGERDRGEGDQAGIMFAGTPDQVFRQIKPMYDHVGGFGHLLIMGQAGFLEHDETVPASACSRARSIRGSSRSFPTPRFRKLGQLAAAG